MYTRAVAAFRASGSIHPVCPTHQKYAKLCVVKDTMKDNYGRPFFVCSERKNPCKFWQWGDVFEGPRPLCQHGMVCCERKVKKDGPNQNRLFYCCPKDDSCGFFEWKQQGPRVTNTGIVLFSNPLQYQYMIEETGETFNSSKSNTKEAYDEFRRFGLTSELDKIDLL
ncbi:endonuclease 8-like 3 [Paramuricea clavata]|uniref:Endonuclease 8-like 3 n=1 Tax=Paramuricea clavata TaxID=317549 RepID=A0A7D9ES32_PARCT|nr:endonuclease 8-like 3 [Paramuricea clavata]